MLPGTPANGALWHQGGPLQRKVTPPTQRVADWEFSMAGIPQPEGDELLEFTGRKFSRFSLQHNVYGIPIDQVRGSSWTCGLLRHLLRCRTTA